ncbi:MAG: hypothetical protein AVDCRST_MAG41-557 [uncultured Corynebacteriales bacterium]|uniref:Uncharacterized protein n=1 Tax=uncultured Mycobacteriales bacterium TaxID=581187 RepID=A0A6J4HFV4_9ACTN|nr:MAG: hypothetical protein AVDCRST_MAG41-557 [uncultured Corynebacteriales bacterium]
MGGTSPGRPGAGRVRHHPPAPGRRSPPGRAQRTQPAQPAGAGCSTCASMSVRRSMRSDAFVCA